MEAKTLTIAEAAKIIDVHPTTLCRMVRNNVIRASKIGRGYKFIQEDLMEDFRSLYNKERTKDKRTKEVKWHTSTRDPAASITRCTSRIQGEAEYDCLLKQKMQKKRKD